jgi:hypothetical protein
MLAARHIVEVWDAEEAMRRRRKKRKEFWVHPMFCLRDVHGQYDNLMAELLNNDSYRYKNFMRIDPGLFQEILRHLEPRIQQKLTGYSTPSDNPISNIYDILHPMNKLFTVLELIIPIF